MMRLTKNQEIREKKNLRGEGGGGGQKTFKNVPYLKGLQMGD
jgi:hypothetical protein